MAPLGIVLILVGGALVFWTFRYHNAQSSGAPYTPKNDTAGGGVYIR